MDSQRNIEASDSRLLVCSIHSRDTGYQGVDLKDIAASGCTICRIAEDGVAKHVKKYGVPSDFPRLLMAQNTSGTLHCVQPSPGRVSESLHLELFIDRENSQNTLKDILGVSGPLFTVQLDKRLDCASSWLHTCIKEHKACDSALPTLPKRVLDLQARDRSSDVALREDVGSATKYACLSHCWGGSQPLKLIQSNLNEMKQVIEWESLPRTFQDAVYVARRLDIRYLWIDSLCIIQDSMDDWLDQAQQMASIYGRSTLTISATRATNCHAGFLQEISLPETMEMPFDIGNGQSQTICIREALDHYQWSISSPFNWKVQDVRTRAWCYQEHLLSPRSLQFGSDEMTFECRESFECECGRANTLIPESYLRSKRNFYSLVEKVSTDVKQLRILWVNILTVYTCRKVSKDIDRLPALAGIIRFISSKTGYVCYAGHWNASFAESLAWGVEYGTAKRVSRGVVPTWSWASLEYEIRVTSMPSMSEFDVDKAEVVHVDCPAIGLQQGQDVRAAALKLRALTLDAELVYDIQSSNGGSKLSLYSPSMIIPGHDGGANRLLLDVVEESQDERQTITCVLLGANHTQNEYEHPDISLMMCRPHATADGYLQRIGIARPLKKHWKASYHSVMTTKIVTII